MKAFEVNVAFTIDGHAYQFDTWSDISALFAIRYLAKHPAPRRGCEVGQCGSCESLVDGRLLRLCQLASTDLGGTEIVTGATHV